MYIGIGNSPQETRRKPSARAMVLLGYIPVSKLECFSKKRRSLEGYQLFHECMKILLKTLVVAGREGVKMRCADGWIRKIFPILAAYIADYPEQCLIAGCKENSCPHCTVDPKRRGEPVHSILRDPKATLEAIDMYRIRGNCKQFEDWSLRAINPFWQDLPHCNIFRCITPDILHQLHKGFSRIILSVGQLR